MPIKLPGLMASIATGFITATLQLGVKPTFWMPPFSPFTVIEPASIAVTVPRTTLGAAGVCAIAALAASVSAATIIDILIIETVPLSP